MKDFITWVTLPGAVELDTSCARLHIWIFDKALLDDKLVEWGVHPTIRRAFRVRGGHGWQYQSHLGTEGLITERVVYAVPDDDVPPVRPQLDDSRQAHLFGAEFEFGRDRGD